MDDLLQHKISVSSTTFHEYLSHLSSSHGFEVGQYMPYKIKKTCKITERSVNGRVLRKEL